MASRRRAIDRRARPRFEVVGDLWGTLELTRPLRLLNLCAGGALVQADQRWRVGSVHSVAIANGIEVGEGRICVKHVRLASENEGGPFLIGVEFLSLTPSLAREIARWSAVDGPPAEREQ